MEAYDIKDDKYFSTLTDRDRGMFTEASNRHTWFINATKQKFHGMDMKAIQDCVQAAENLYLQLLNSHPFWDQLLYQLATLYLQTNRNGLTINLLKPLAERTDAKIEYVANLGAAYRNEHFNKEAGEAFERCLALERVPDVLANMCALWVNEGYPEKGIPYGRECLAMNPKHNQGRWNLGLLLLENDQWAEGFKLYRQGFETGERIIRLYRTPSGENTPFWNGEDLNGKTIVLHGEQGIGDELLFAQFLFPLIQQFPEAKVILDCHPRLEALMRRSIPGLAAVYPTRKADPEWNKDIPVDYKDGLGSLPAYYWETMSQNAGWLKPDPVLVAYYRDIIQRLQKENNEVGYPVVGIAWEGGKKKTRNDLRSIGLEQWEPILKNKCTYISLQYTPEAAKECARLRKATGIVVNHWPDVTERTEYEHSVALAYCTDLVIGVNTSIIHVCGSMGHPCWTLTPHGHAWRYGKKERVNPFYKSVEQFHQDPDEDWKRIIQKVGFRLAYLGGEK